MVFAQLSLISRLFATQTAFATALAAPLSWPMYQYQANHEAVFNGPVNGVNWHRRLGGQINGGLAIAGNILYVESFDKNVYALDTRTGAVRWSSKPRISR